MKRLEALIPLVKPFYTPDDPAHDWPHIGRVIATARKLAVNENVDLPCLLAGVYCHDIVNLPKNHPDRTRASELAAEKAAPLLKASGFNDDEIKKIQQIVIEHSFSKGLKPSTLEAAIVQDSDRLDTLGAIGVLRCASVNTQMKAAFYDPFDPLAQDRPLDDKKFMVDHFFVKIFKLPDLMNTQKGREEAQHRVEFMKVFLDTLMAEAKG